MCQKKKFSLFKSFVFCIFFLVTILTTHSFAGSLPKGATSDLKKCKNEILPQAGHLYESLNTLYSESLDRQLDCKDKKVINKLSAAERSIFESAVAELENLSVRKITPADYMLSLVKRAESISADFAKTQDLVISRKTFSSKAKLGIYEKQKIYFVHLISVVFSYGAQPNWDGLLIKLGRRFFGISSNRIGEILERIYEKKIIEFYEYARRVSNEAGKTHLANLGFNENVLDVKTEKSTVTHHFRELFVLGFVKGKFWGKMATRFNDSYDKNPGDVKCGLFAAMAGDALNKNKITVPDLVKLIEWAFSDLQQTPPIWSRHARDYKIEGWKEQYLRAKKN